MSKLKPQTLDEFVKKVRCHLISLAKAGETVEYRCLEAKCRLPRQNTGEILGRISELEQEDGGPLLSAIVVRKDPKGTRLPGAGFFGFAPEDIRWHPKETLITPELKEKRGRWAQLQQSKVFSWWKEDDQASEQQGGGYQQDIATKQLVEKNAIERTMQYFKEHGYERVRYVGAKVID